MKANSPLERLYNGIIKENPTFVLMLGMCLTGLLRMAALAYLFAVSIKLEPASLMDMSPAAAPMMAFAAVGAARWLEEKFSEKASSQKA